jgi:AraC family transcriptional regulator
MEIAKQTPLIIQHPAQVLVGKWTDTSWSASDTFLLWRSFKSGVKEIGNRTDSDFVSVSIYPPAFLSDSFTPASIFRKWAAVAVSSAESLPEGMEVLIIPEGQYAVFEHHGLASDFPATFQYIFFEWLPTSGYELDDRPHFEVMGPAYALNDPEASEYMWIPIK